MCLGRTTCFPKIPETIDGQRNELNSTLMHFWEYCSYFLTSASYSAKPLFIDAFVIRSGSKGEVTVISNAAD